MEKQFLDETVLADLEDRMTCYPHLQELNAVLSDEEWERKGKPHVWNLESSKDGWELLFDSGWGNLALFYRSKLVDLGKNVVSDPKGEVIGLNESYSPASGLYFRN